MNPTFWTPARIAGALLASTFLLLLIALVIMLASGAFSAFSGAIRGEIEKRAPYAGTFRLTTLMFSVSWVLPMLGFGLLTLLLLRKGDEYLSPMAFVLILAASILAILYATFRMVVDQWAAGVAAQTGNVPAIFGALSEWISSFFKIAYIAHLVAVILYGWALLRTGFLAPWVGQVAIGWSLLWLLGALVGAGAPAIPLLMPAVIGVALLFGRS